MWRRRYWPAVALAMLTTGILVCRHSGTAVARVVGVGRHPTYLAVDGRTHHAFVTDQDDNAVAMLDAGSGALLRTIAVARAPISVAVSTTGSRAFVLGSDGSVSVLTATGGAVVRTLRLNQTTALAVDEETGHVFALSGTCAPTGTVYMLDARTGSVVRTTLVGGAPWGLAVDTRTRRVFVSNMVSNTLSVLDAESGALLRSVAVGNGPTRVAVDERTDRVFVANNGAASVSVLDAGSGRVLRTVALDTKPETLQVAVATDRVFVVSVDGVVNILDARTGVRVGRTMVGPTFPLAVGEGANPAGVAVDDRWGHAFVLHGSSVDSSHTLTNGSVSVLDARDGRLLRTIPVGRAPNALVVDEATAQLYVVNSEPAMPRDSVGWVPVWVSRWLPWLPRATPPTHNGSVSILDLAGV